MPTFTAPLSKAIDLWSHGQHIDRAHHRALLDDGWTGEDIARMEHAHFRSTEEFHCWDDDTDGVAVLGES